MVSAATHAPLYAVQVRFGNSYRELACDCESTDFLEAKRLAAQVLRWLQRGHCSDLPADALDLPDQLRALGIDPAACAVEVVRLANAGAGRYDLRGEVLCQVIDLTPDDEDDDLEDTVTYAEEVSVPAVRRW